MYSEDDLPAPIVACSNDEVGKECHPLGKGVYNENTTRMYPNNIPPIYFETQEKFNELQEILNKCYQKRRRCEESKKKTFFKKSILE